MLCHKVSLARSTSVSQMSCVLKGHPGVKQAFKVKDGPMSVAGQQCTGSHWCSKRVSGLSSSGIISKNICNFPKSYLRASLLLAMYLCDIRFLSVTSTEVFHNRWKVCAFGGLQLSWIKPDTGEICSNAKRLPLVSCSHFDFRNCSYLS